MVISPQGIWFMVLIISCVKSETKFSDLESLRNQELNKTIQEFDKIPKTISQPPNKPFLPFSNLGAPAGPSKLKKEENQVAKSILHSIHKGIYTTLDKLPPKKSKINVKKLVGENLGGLSPEEIYYIDKDLLIIKGGDFEGKKYFKKYGHRRKNAKRLRRIKNKAHKTPLGLRFTSSSERTSNNASSEEVEDSNTPPISSIPTSELSLFLPSFQVQSRQQKLGSAYNYFFMPPPQNIIQDHIDILPQHLNLFEDYFHPHPLNFHSQIHYQDDYEYHPHFRRNNEALHTNWLPDPLKVVHSFYGDTNINYKFPKKLPNPHASWISLKSNLK
ncbi:UNVERIFIED_CONTAM: hypothetical protein RMT77_015925 [Armadillidium vulgare]